MKSTLISFESKKPVRFVLYDLFRNLDLAPHSIDSHHRPLQKAVLEEAVEDERESGYLVGFLGDPPDGQDKEFDHGVDDVDIRLPFSSGEAAGDCLSVQGYDVENLAVFGAAALPLLGGPVLFGCDGEEPVAKLGGVDLRDRPGDGVNAGYVGQAQEGHEEIGVMRDVFPHRKPAVAAGHDSDQADHDQAGEGVLGPALDPGVVERAEVGAGLSVQAAAGDERGVGHGGLVFGHGGPPG